MKCPWVLYLLKTVTFFAAILLMGGEKGLAEPEPNPPPSPPAIEQAADGTLTLDAGTAKITGPSILLEGGNDQNIGGWSGADDYLSWLVQVTKPGQYRVEMIYSEDPKYPGSTLILGCGTEKLEIKPYVTDSWTTYRTVKVGEISLDQAGPAEISLKVAQKASFYVINLKRIFLIPKDKPSTAEDMVPVRQQTVLPPTPPDADGTFSLTPLNGEIVGPDARVENDNNDIGVWDNANTYLHWSIKVNKPGKYNVLWIYSTGKDCEGSPMMVTIGNAAPLETTPTQTLGWDDYKEASVGEVTLNTTGPMDVIVKAEQIRGIYVMNLQSIKITPVAP